MFIAPSFSNVYFELFKLVVGKLVDEFSSYVVNAVPAPLFLGLLEDLTRTYRLSFIWFLFIAVIPVVPEGV